jgi:hypothetical protein
MSEGALMNVRTITLAVSVLSLTAAFLAPPASAQTKPDDSFEITLLYPVTIGNKILQPGDYKVEPLTIAGGDAPVLLFRGPNDTKQQIAAKTIPTVENRLQPETRVLYHHVGDRYYFDRIWVKGVAYGYRFELPKNVKAARDER